MTLAQRKDIAEDQTRKTEIKFLEADGLLVSAMGDLPESEAAERYAKAYTLYAEHATKAAATWATFATIAKAEGR